MNTKVAEYLSQAELDGAQEFKNLVMAPIVSRYRDGGNYLLLDDALQQEILKVMEVDRQGSVPDLKVVNTSGSMVLVLTARNWWAPSRTGSSTPPFFLPRNRKQPSRSVVSSRAGGPTPVITSTVRSG